MFLCSYGERSPFYFLIPPLLSHAHLSLLATASVCFKDCPFSALSVQFCLRSFAILLLNPFAVSDIYSGFLAAVISCSLLSCMYFCSPSIAVLVMSSILMRPHSPSFLHRYSLSTLLFGCKALCVIVNFLVLRSKERSSSLFQSRKGTEYVTTATAQVLIALIKLWPFSFVSKTFINLLLYSFFILSFISDLFKSSASSTPRYS